MKTLATTFACLVILLSGCGTESSDQPQDTSGRDQATESPTQDQPDLSTPEGRLQHARETWATNGLEDYRWTYSQVCYCPQIRMRIDVEQGQATSWVNLANRKDRTDPQVRTMEDLFDLIEEALPDAELVEVRYDQHTGAVRRVSVDRDRLAVDDEYTYRVGAVQPR